MKKSVDILGLPVISIIEGIELGTAKALVIDSANGVVAAVALDDGKWYLETKLLPFASIAGLGESAITVESQNELMLVSNAPDLEKHLAADVKIIGSKVLTKTGRIQGKVTEYAVDLTGKIISCEIDNNGEISQLPASQVVTFGKEVMIITDGENYSPAAKPVLEPAIVAPEVTEAIAPETAASPAPASAPVEPEPVQDDSSKKFEDKQRKYLLGKKVTKRIESDNGVIIVEAGAEITEEVIQKAKLAGKFVELSMNI